MPVRIFTEHFNVPVLYFNFHSAALNLKFISWLLSLLNCIAIGSTVVYVTKLLFANDEELGIWKLVMVLLLLSACFVRASLLIGEYGAKEDWKVIYSRILQINDSMNATLTKQSDWVFLAFTCSYVWSLVSCLAYYIYDAQLLNIALVISFILIFNEVLSWITTEYVIAKRLHYIRSSDEYLDRIEDTISHTRQLLECNSDVNKGIQLLVTTFAIYIFTKVQSCSYALLAIYGYGVDMPNAFENNLVATFFASGPLAILTILLTWASDLVDDEVGEIKLELDATWTARPCNENQRKMISLFLMELHYMPVQLSGKGLFDIKKTSVAAGCVLIISYLLVLIQFT